MYAESDGGGLSPVVSGILGAVTMLVAVTAIGGVWCLWRRRIIRYNGHAVYLRKCCITPQSALLQF